MARSFECPAPGHEGPVEIQGATGQPIGRERVGPMSADFETGDQIRGDRANANAERRQIGECPQRVLFATGLAVGACEPVQHHGPVLRSSH